MCHDRATVAKGAHCRQKEIRCGIFGGQYLILSNQTPMVLHRFINFKTCIHKLSDPLMSTAVGMDFYYLLLLTVCGCQFHYQVP